MGRGGCTGWWLHTTENTATTAEVTRTLWVWVVRMLHSAWNAAPCVDPAATQWTASKRLWAWTSTGSCLGWCDCEWFSYTISSWFHHLRQDANIVHLTILLPLGKVRISDAHADFRVGGLLGHWLLKKKQGSRADKWLLFGTGSRLLLLGMHENSHTLAIPKLLWIRLRPFSWLHKMICWHGMKPLGIINIARLLQPLKG